jgi:hypothetical protein
MKKIIKIHIALIILVFASAVAKSQTKSDFKLRSSVFQEGNAIPGKYTCDGANISPPLSWSGAPKNTKSFALIMDDPDANSWVHWVVLNIPDTVTGLKERNDVSEIKAVNGLNSWQDEGYRGPCPPNGIHRYTFKLYALDKILDQKGAMTKPQLLNAMKDHILGTATLTGTFSY